MLQRINDAHSSPPRSAEETGSNWESSVVTHAEANGAPCGVLSSLSAVGSRADCEVPVHICNFWTSAAWVRLPPGACAVAARRILPSRRLGGSTRPGGVRPCFGSPWGRKQGGTMCTVFFCCIV
nr:PREDICTED: uncharacterized protein LOC109569523 [Bos indicus]